MVMNSPVCLLVADSFFCRSELACMDAGEGREQDAEALLATDIARKLSGNPACIGREQARSYSVTRQCRWMLKHE